MKITARTHNRAVITIDASDKFAENHARSLGLTMEHAKDGRGVVRCIYVLTTPKIAREFLAYCE